MQIKSVTQTFDLICMIELRSELMLNIVALNERLELVANLYKTRNYITGSGISLSLHFSL